MSLIEKLRNLKAFETTAKCAWCGEELGPFYSLGNAVVGFEAIASHLEQKHGILNANPTFAGGVNLSSNDDSESDGFVLAYKIGGDSDEIFQVFSEPKRISLLTFAWNGLRKVLPRNG